MGRRKIGGLGPVAPSMELSLQNLYLVAIRVGDKSHLALAGRELLPPSIRPDCDASALNFVTVGDDVGNAHAGVHEVLGKLDPEVRRVSEFKEVLVAGKMEESELVALGRVSALPEFEAELLVEGNGGIGIGDPDAGMEKPDHVDK